MVDPIYPDVIEAFGGLDAKHVRSARIEVGRPSYQQFQQKQARLTLDPYVLDKGQPTADTGYGVAGTTTAYLTTNPTVTDTINPISGLVTGSDYRFLPTAAYTGTGGGGGAGVTSWFPVGGSISTYPQLIVRKQGATVDPVIASAYSYEAKHKRLAQPAFTMNTAGYFEMKTANGSVVNYTQATFLMVFVPHNGPGPWYPIYDSGPVTSSSRRFRVIYRKGTIQVIAGNTRILQHQVIIDHSEPIIVAFSYDGPAKVGRMVVIDRRRTSRSFNVNTIVGMDMNAWIGIRPTTEGGATPDYNYVADMDVLEIDIWLNKALDFRQLEDVTSILARGFQVGP